VHPQRACCSASFCARAVRSCACTAVVSALADATAAAACCADAALLSCALAWANWFSIARTVEACVPPILVRQWIPCTYVCMYACVCVRVCTPRSTDMARLTQLQLAVLLLLPRCRSARVGQCGRQLVDLTLRLRPEGLAGPTVSNGRDGEQAEAGACLFVGGELPHLVTQALQLARRGLGTLLGVREGGCQVPRVSLGSPITATTRTRWYGPACVRASCTTRSARRLASSRCASVASMVCRCAACAPGETHMSTSSFVVCMYVCVCVRGARSGRQCGCRAQQRRHAGDAARRRPHPRLRRGARRHSQVQARRPAHARATTACAPGCPPIGQPRTA
jgi:hypothetical protein